MDNARIPSEEETRAMVAKVWAGRLENITPDQKAAREIARKLEYAPEKRAASIAAAESRFLAYDVNDVGCLNADEYIAYIAAEEEANTQESGGTVTFDEAVQRELHAWIVQVWATPASTGITWDSFCKYFGHTKRYFFEEMGRAEAKENECPLGFALQSQ